MMPRKISLLQLCNISGMRQYAEIMSSICIFKTVPKHSRMHKMIQGNATQSILMKLPCQRITLFLFA